MWCVLFFFFNDTATTEIYTYRHTLSLHDALPISRQEPPPVTRRRGGSHVEGHLHTGGQRGLRGAPEGGGRQDRRGRPGEGRVSRPAGRLGVGAPRAVRLRGRRHLHSRSLGIRLGYLHGPEGAGRSEEHTYELQSLMRI